VRAAVCGHALSRTSHYTVCQHSTSFFFWMALSSFFFSVSQHTSDVIVVPCCINFTISTPFLSQMTVSISFLAGRQRLFKISGLVWWMCVHPLLWLLLCFNIHKWSPSFITCYSYDVIEKFTAIFVVSLQKTKAILCVLCAPVCIFGTHLAQNLWQPSLTVIIL
jgi:hypothetical protein